MRRRPRITTLTGSYLREYAALGTAGGLYHFRDVILKSHPEQIIVIHADVCCSYPLEEMRAFHATHRGVGTIMGVKVPRDTANKFGCIVVNPDNKQAMHYVEKPESFLSEIINGGIYLFDKSIFDEIKTAMDEKVRKAAEDPLLDQGDELRLEQDVLAPMAEGRRLYVYQTTSFWRQIKTAGSAVPANALMLAAYKTTNPALLRQRSPTVATPAARPSVDYLLAGRKPTAEIVEPCFIDETAHIDPSAKIGPNVSIGAHCQIGAGCRVRDSILLDNVSLDVRASRQRGCADTGAELLRDALNRRRGVQDRTVGARRGEPTRVRGRLDQADDHEYDGRRRMT